MCPVNVNLSFWVFFIVRRSIRVDETLVVDR